VRALDQLGYTRLVVAGGVGANKVLRTSLSAELQSRGGQAFYPRPELCTDNGAMVAHAGLLRLASGQAAADGVITRARWPLDDLGAIVGS
jgi:N6-L-threonylcarbamoyladenine synthase